MRRIMSVLSTGPGQTVYVDALGHQFLRHQETQPASVARVTHVCLHQVVGGGAGGGVNHLIDPRALSPQEPGEAYL